MTAIARASSCPAFAPATCAIAPRPRSAAPADRGAFAASVAWQEAQETALRLANFFDDASEDSRRRLAPSDATPARTMLVLLASERAALVAEDATTRALLRAVAEAEHEDLESGDVDAIACNLHALEEDLRAGLDAVEVTRDEATMRALVARFQEAWEASERLAAKRVVRGRVPPWPVPPGPTIYEVLEALARGPRLPSNAERIRTLDLEAARLRSKLARENRLPPRDPNERH